MQRGWCVVLNAFLRFLSDSKHSRSDDADCSGRGRRASTAIRLRVHVRSIEVVQSNPGHSGAR